MHVIQKQLKTRIVHCRAVTLSPKPAMLQATKQNNKQHLHGSASWRVYLLAGQKSFFFLQVQACSGAFQQVSNARLSFIC